MWSYVLFFFKQKTAYEMRISDWSSDVCFSDLGDHPIRDLGGLVLEHDEAVAHAVVQVGNLARLDLGGARGNGGIALLPVDLLQLDGDHEIGRASCRERVCQYV